MIALRPMTMNDLALGMRLKQQAGWNQLEVDWQRLLDLQPDGCFVAEWDGVPAGTVVTCLFGPVAWVAMVLVDESLRGRGIGRALMGHALEFLDSRRIESVRLDATSLGQPLYETLGFVPQFSVVRFAGQPVSIVGGAECATVFPDESQLADVIALDRRITHTERGRLLRRFFAESPASVQVVAGAEGVTGYLTSRPGSRAIQVGPGVALDDTAGEQLLCDVLRRNACQPVFVDIPEQNSAAAQVATRFGLTEQRRLLRMCRGKNVCEELHSLWASSGPEKG